MEYPSSTRSLTDYLLLLFIAANRFRFGVVRWVRSQSENKINTVVIILKSSFRCFPKTRLQVYVFDNETICANHGENDGTETSVVPCRRRSITPGGLRTKTKLYCTWRPIEWYRVHTSFGIISRTTQSQPETKPVVAFSDATSPRNRVRRRFFVRRNRSLR